MRNEKIKEKNFRIKFHFRVNTPEVDSSPNRSEKIENLRRFVSVGAF